MIIFDVNVGVPTTAAAAVQLDKTNSAPHQSPGHQTKSAEFFCLGLIDPVHPPGRYAFFCDFDSFWGRSLHAKSQLVRVQACRQLSVVFLVSGKLTIQRIEEIQFTALLTLSNGLRGREITNGHFS